MVRIYRHAEARGFRASKKTTGVVESCTRSWDRGAGRAGWLPHSGRSLTRLRQTVYQPRRRRTALSAPVRLSSPVVEEVWTTGRQTRLRSGPTRALAPNSQPRRLSHYAHDLLTSC